MRESSINRNYEKNNTLISCQECSTHFEGFETLSFHQFEAFKSSHCKVSYSKGETILKEGTMVTHLVCLKKGFAKVHVQGCSTRKIILRIIKAGDFIVSPGIFDDNINHFSVTAITDCEICLISLKAFEEAFQENTDFAKKIMKQNHQNIQTLYNQLVSLSHKKMTGRVAETLLYLSQSVYESNVFFTTLSRQELADMSGVSKESLIRILKDLKESGIVVSDGHKFHIHSPSSLLTISKVG
jgi:CRP/FNR family transcriptional regulator